MDGHSQRLDEVVNPEMNLKGADNQQQLLESKKEVPPEPPHTNEEQVKLQTSRDGEKLQELVGRDNPSSIAEDCGGSQHLTLRHATATKPLSCPLCDETFTHEMYLTTHMGEQHEGEQPFSCCVCEKSYATLTHECVGESSQRGVGGSEAAGNSHPDGLLPPLSDEEDWAETGFNGQWMEPLEPQSRSKAPKRPYTPVIRSYVCSLCGKKHRRRKGLVSHMHMHSVAKNAFCRVCHKRFTFQSQLKTYVCLCEPFQHQPRRPEEKENPPASSSSELMQTGADASDVDMNSHPDELIPPFSDEETINRAETGSSEPQSDLISVKNKKCDLRCNTDKKPFNSLTFGCSLCCKEFATRINLVAHLTCHSGSSRTKCRVCKKKFEFRSQRNTYSCSCDSSQLIPTTEHAGEETFSCPVCEQSFTTVTQLDQHRSTTEAGGSKETVDRMTAMRRSEAKKLLGSYSGFECNEEMQTEADIDDSGESKPARKSVRIKTLRCRDAKESFSSDSCSEHNSSEELQLFGYPYYSQGIYSYNPLLMPDGESEAEGNSLLLQHPADDSGQRTEPTSLSRHTSVQTNIHKGAGQEPLHIKEEQEEHWISQKEEQLQGLVVVEIPETKTSNQLENVFIKSEKFLKLQAGADDTVRDFLSTIS